MKRCVGNERVDGVPLWMSSSCLLRVLTVENEEVNGITRGKHLITWCY